MRYSYTCCPLDKQALGARVRRLVSLYQHLFRPDFTVRTHYHAGYWHNHVYHRAWWDHVYHPTKWQWYDVMSWAAYALHFPESLIVGFAIWLRTREGFRRFSVAFLTL